MFKVSVDFYFETIINKGWPTKAKSRYKKFDVANREKLLLDALSKATAVDDSQFVEIRLRKFQDPLNIGVILTLEEVQEDDYVIN